MNLFQALVYFFREAVIGLVRSWRVSLLAIVTIGVSLFLAGGFLLTSRNLSRAIHEWKLEARFVVYLAERSGSEDRTAAECAARGGAVVSAGSCMPNPCGGTPPVGTAVVCCIPDDTGPEPNHEEKAE